MALARTNWTKPRRIVNRLNDKRGFNGSHDTLPIQSSTAKLSKSCCYRRDAAAAVGFLLETRQERRTQFLDEDMSDILRSDAPRPRQGASLPTRTLLIVECPDSDGAPGDLKLMET